jgi:membrane associated rhomboid family serine protease
VSRRTWFSRGRGGPGFFAGARITRGALYLLFAEAGLTLVYVFLNAAGRDWFHRHIAASSISVWRDGKIWTLVTGVFFQPQFVSLIFHGLILWMFIPALERWWGTRRFLFFALLTAVSGTTVGTLVGSFLPDETFIVGLDAFIYASIAAYGVLFARHPVQFFGVLPMTGKQLAIGITGFVTLYVLVSGLWADGAAYGFAMGLAWTLTSDHFRPRLWWLTWRQKRLRGHLSVVGDKDEKRWLN